MVEKITYLHFHISHPTNHMEVFLSLNTCTFICESVVKCFQVMTAYQLIKLTKKKISYRCKLPTIVMSPDGWPTPSSERQLVFCVTHSHSSAVPPMEEVKLDGRERKEYLKHSTHDDFHLWLLQQKSRYIDLWWWRKSLICFFTFLIPQIIWKFSSLSLSYSKDKEMKWLIKSKNEYNAVTHPTLPSLSFCSMLNPMKKPESSLYVEKVSGGWCSFPHCTWITNE